MLKGPSIRYRDYNRAGLVFSLTNEDAEVAGNVIEGIPSIYGFDARFCLI